MDKVDQDLLMCRYWKMARMQTMSPKVVKSHQSQVLSVPVAKSVECLTIKVHFARDRPNPAKAPYLKISVKRHAWLPVSFSTYQAAIVRQKHIVSRNPIQLKRNEVVKAVKKMKSLPKRVVSFRSPLVLPGCSESSMGNVKRVNPGRYPRDRLLLRPPRRTSYSSLLESELASSVTLIPIKFGSNFPSKERFDLSTFKTQFMICQVYL